MYKICECNNDLPFFVHVDQELVKKVHHSLLRMMGQAQKYSVKLYSTNMAVEDTVGSIYNPSVTRIANSLRYGIHICFALF